MKLEKGKSIVEEVEKLGIDKNLHGEVSAPHLEAIITMDAKRKAVEKMLKSKTEEADKVLKLDDHPTLKTEDGKKMHLTESLFEDYEEDDEEDTDSSELKSMADLADKKDELNESYNETAFEMTTDGKKGNGTYRWMNRPWQRFTYSSALRDAMINAGIDRDFANECENNSHSLESAIKYFADNYGKKKEVNEAMRYERTKYDVLYDGLVKAKYSDGSNSVPNAIGEFAATDSSDNAPFDGIKVTSTKKENLDKAIELAKRIGLKTELVDHTNNANLGNKYFLFIEMDEEIADELLYESHSKPLKEELKLYTEIGDYQPWSGAVETWDKIVELNKVDELERLLEDAYPEGLSITELNDLLWFEDKWVFEMLGISEEAEEDED